jgi:hypothetical protein
MAKYTINQLIKADSEFVYCLNTSINTSKYKRSTNVAFDVQSGNQVRSVMVHDSWIPQDLSQQAPKEIILASPSFREAINRGHIELVRDEDAEKILSEEDAIVEMQRLRNKYNTAVQDLNMEPIAPRDIIVQKDTDDGISPMVKDLCVHNEEDPLEPVAVYSRLRTAQNTLSKEEYMYLNKNLHASCRDAKIDEFLKKKLAA